MEFMTVPNTYYEQLREKLKDSKVKISEDLSVLEVCFSSRSPPFFPLTKQKVHKELFGLDTQMTACCSFRSCKFWWTTMMMATSSRSSPNQSRIDPLCSWRLFRGTTTRSVRSELMDIIYHIVYIILVGRLRLCLCRDDQQIVCIYTTVYYRMLINSL